MTTSCPLCDAEVEYTITRYRPATYDSPAEGGEVEDIEPSCECMESPCVSEGKYLDLIVRRIYDELESYDPMDDGDAAYEEFKDRQLFGD